MDDQNQYTLIISLQSLISVFEPIFLALNFEPLSFYSNYEGIRYQLTSIAKFQFYCWKFPYLENCGLSRLVFTSNESYTANLYRDLWGFYREMVVQGFHIYRVSLGMKIPVIVTVVLHEIHREC